MKCPQTVIKYLPDGQKEIAVIDLHEDVLYAIEAPGGRLIYHTADCQYYAISRPEDMDELLGDFWMMDAHNAVNVTKIKRVEPSLKAYFEQYPTKQSKFASISWLFMKLCQDLIQQMIEENISKDQKSEAM